VIAEPSTESRDTKPSAEAGEFAEFFERGVYADGQVNGQEQPDPEVDEAPVITAEQLPGAPNYNARQACSSLPWASLPWYYSQHAPRGLHWTRFQ
jgi:hypothetical protein